MDMHFGKLTGWLSSNQVESPLFWLLGGTFLALVYNIYEGRRRVSRGVPARPDANFVPRAPDDVLRRLATKVKPMPGRTFSKSELSKYTGTRRVEDPDGEKIYVAVAELVYDVSPSRSLYGPGATYEVFAGKDITLSLAKGRAQHLDPSTDQDYSGVTEAEREALQRWIDRLSAKYEVVGILDTEREDQ